MHLTSAIGPAKLDVAKLDLASGRVQSRAASSLPSMDAIVEAQARFRIEGAGALSGRTITPASAGAASLVSKAPASLDAVRGVLRLVEHVAGGPAASAKVDLAGVSFALTGGGLAANTWRAHVDDDATFRAGLAKVPARGQAMALDWLARTKQAETAGMLANVSAGWMNVGQAASAGLLGHAAGRAGSAQSPQQLADSVRILLHESVHAVDTAPANLPSQAMHGVWEALAEARTMTMPQLQAARGALGLDGAVPDAALARTLQHRPYAAAERTLAGVLKTAGIASGSALEQRVLRSPASEAIELLTTRMAAVTGNATAHAREAIATAFADSMPPPG